MEAFVNSIHNDTDKPTTFMLSPYPRELWLSDRYEHLMMYVERCQLQGTVPLALHMRELREIARELKK